MIKRSFMLAFLFAVVLLALMKLAAAQDARRLPTNKELVSRAQSV